jgi:LuxR family maltose regulon positive regulatory protein
MYLSDGRAGTVTRWLESFTLEQIAAEAQLTLTAAWSAVTAPQTQPIEHWIELARRGGDVVLPDGTPLPAAVALLDAVAAERGLTAMAEDAARAYALEREGSPYRAIAAYLEGTALRLLGEQEAARNRLLDGSQRGYFVPGTAAGSLAELALLAIDGDDWGEAAGVVERARAIATQHSLEERPAQVLLFATSALVQAHHGLPDAQQDALRTRRLLTMLHHITPWLAIEARFVLARAELLLGAGDVARLLVREGGDLLARFPDPGLLVAQHEALAEALASAAAGAGGYTVPLTTAELRVLRYLPTHLSFQAMADELFVSRNTVKTQAIAIYRKLGVSSRGEAVARATELHLLDR